MDISSFPINLNPFKEPRGFIRILQFVRFWSWIHLFTAVEFLHCHTSFYVHYRCCRYVLSGLPQTSVAILASKSSARRMELRLHRLSLKPSNILSSLSTSWFSGWVFYNVLHVFLFTAFSVGWIMNRCTLRHVVQLMIMFSSEIILQMPSSSLLLGCCRCSFLWLLLSCTVLAKRCTKKTLLYLLW